MEPPGTAPGSEPLITRAFMSIVPLRRPFEYRLSAPEFQEGIASGSQASNQSFNARVARLVARASGWISQ